MKIPFLFSTIVAVSSGILQAAVLIPTDAAAWDKGSGGANGTGSGGLLQTTTLEVALDKKGEPNNPAVWVNSTEGWDSDFQGQDVASLTNNPWIVYDLGSVQSALDFVYIITNVEANRGFKDINIHYSSDLSTNPISTWASLSGLTDGGANVVDYDFTAGGWTQHGSTVTLVDANDAFGTQEQPSTGFDISGITSARYIGIEGLTTFDGGSSGRAGINQIAFTVVPEPSAALLGALGFLALLRRRR